MARLSVSYLHGNKSAKTIFLIQMEKWSDFARKKIFFTVVLKFRNLHIQNEIFCYLVHGLWLLLIPVDFSRRNIHREHNLHFRFTYIFIDRIIFSLLCNNNTTLFCSFVIFCLYNLLKFFIVFCIFLLFFVNGR